MKQDEIIEITRQTGGFSPTPEFLEAFAKLVAAKEREACAQICDKEQADWGWDADVVDAARAIRARGEA